MFRSLAGWFRRRTCWASQTESAIDTGRPAIDLSRAVIPVQDIKGGRVRIQVIEGSFAELEISGDDKNAFGTRAILNVVLRESPSRLGTLERQLLIVNGDSEIGVADTAIDEIGTATGRFRLIVKLKTWHVYASLGMDNAGTTAAGPLQGYSTTAFNSAIARAIHWQSTCRPCPMRRGSFATGGSL